MFVSTALMIDAFAGLHEPLTTLDDVEEITADWVHRHNTSRPMHRLGRQPPVEHEADYQARNRDGQQSDHT